MAEANSTLSDGVAKLIIQPARPRAETAFTLRLKLPPETTPKLSRLVAVSMPMGSVPVVWESSARTDTSLVQWSATVMVGACGEPTMTWALEIPTTGSEHYRFPITTRN